MYPASTRSRCAGLTLVELMVVVAILGAVLLLVPPNLHAFGARSRLENSANTIISLVAAARQQAILDGQPVKVEFAIYKDEDGDEHHAHRMTVSGNPVQRAAKDEDGEREERERVEKEWISTPWFDLSGGVEYAGYSEEAEDWEEIRRDRPYVIEFGPDGGVEKGFALRVFSAHLKEKGKVRKRNYTITIIVNAMTAEGSATSGLTELPPQRDEHDFPR